MRKFTLMLALLGASSMVLASCGPGQEEQHEDAKKVNSVSLSASRTNLYVGDSIKVVVSVAGEGLDNDSKKVTWTSSNSSVATVDANGNVSAIAGGTVKITATSTFDSSKKGEITLNITEGFSPEFIDEGFTYSKNFPVNEIKTYLGSGDYQIVSPSGMLAGGAYYLNYSGEDGTCFVVAIDGALAQSYAYDLFQKGFERVYYSSNNEAYEAVDPTGKYTVSFYNMMDSTTYDEVGPTFIEFYKSEDVWGSSELTEDTAWDLEKIVNEDADDIAAAKEWIEKLPFVALGEDYCIEYCYDYSAAEEIIMFLEYLGLDVDSLSDKELLEVLYACGFEGPEVYLSVYDYSLCEPFEGYDQVLLDAGYEYLTYEDEDGYEYEYYEKAYGLDAYDVTFGFAETGNTIYMEKLPAILEAFPVNEANEFIENVLGSENSIIAYEETQGAAFQAVIGEEKMQIVMDNATVSEVEAYAAKLVDAGFEVEFDEEYVYWSATKGKLVFDFYVEVEYDEETYEPISEEGPVYFFIYADPNKHEEQGIYLPETINTNVKMGSVELEPELVKLGDSFNLSWSSDNEEIATVDTEGVVTLKGVGEVNITVTTDVAIPDVGGFYSATVKLVVAEKPDFAPILADANEALQDYDGTEVLSAANLPEIDCASYDSDDYLYSYGCYVIWGDGVNETEASYAEKVEGLGFEVLEDDYGKYYETEEYQICFSLDEDEDGDYFQIEIYFLEAESEAAYDDVVVSEYFENQGTLTSINTELGGSIVFDKKTGNEPKFYSADGARLYSGNTITFTAPEGSYITAIEFEKADYGSKSEAPITVDSGSYDEYFYSAPEGGVESVTFTVGSGGQWRWSECIIEYNGDGSGGGGGGIIDIDVDAALEDIEDMIVDIAAKFSSKSASEITVAYDYEDDGDVYVYDYSDYGFIYAEYVVDSSTALNTMKNAIPSGASFEEELSYEEDEYHDLWYSVGDYLVGIYTDGDYAAFSVVPYEMFETYYYNIYSFE